MTLDQLQALQQWHQHHQDERPMEGRLWSAVLMLWLLGWVGAPAAWLLEWDLATLAGGLLVFVPGRYVAWRERLHRRGRLRCDWIVALR